MLSRGTPIDARDRNKTFASSKKTAADAKRAAEILAHSGPEKSGKRGQPSKSDSTRAVAEAIGTSRQNIERAEQHVELAERFPWLQSSDWAQADVLRRRRLGARNPPDVERAAAASPGSSVLWSFRFLSSICSKICIYTPNTGPLPATFVS
jgi:hypothetical protein